MFESVKLKGQKAKPTDIITYGKPMLKQWQLKPLCSLSSKDQDFLLAKVSISYIRKVVRIRYFYLPK